MTEPAPAELLNEDELLFRQVNPNWLRDGSITSQAFKPMASDHGQVSVDRGSLTTPAAAHEFFTGVLGFSSAGTWALSVGEVRGNPVPLCAFGSPETETLANPSHGHIEFRDLPRRDVEAKAKSLRAAATSRGRQHPRG